MIERQVIVTWYTPAEKLPEEDISVVATVSGKSGSNHYDHAIVNLCWCEDEGWYSDDCDFDCLIVHAWCDLKPYSGDHNSEMKCLGE